MSSMDAGRMFDVARQDASRFSFVGPINLKDISEADARIIVSTEHKALGYRPPPGSLAAQAQAIAARHQTQADNTPTVDAEKLRQAALADAERIKKRHTDDAATIDLDLVGETEARRLVSEEHKALGYRPPSGSLAADIQAAAAKHPNASCGADAATLARAALADSSHIVTSTTQLDVECLGRAEARTLMSEEHRALGYRPPHGSLAATAQAAAAKHPNANSGLDAATLAQAALNDAKRIEAERASAQPPPLTIPNLKLVLRQCVRGLSLERERKRAFEEVRL